MYTVTDLQKLATSYNVKGRSKLRKKSDLLKAVRNAIKDEKLAKRPSRNHELQLLDSEVDNLLFAKSYNIKLNKNPNLAIEAKARLKTKQRLQKIISEGPKILQEKIGLKDTMEKGRRMIRFRYFNDLENNISNKMVEKLEPYLTSCYLKAKAGRSMLKF